MGTGGNCEQSVQLVQSAGMRLHCTFLPLLAGGGLSSSLSSSLLALLSLCCDSDSALKSEASSAELSAAPSDSESLTNTCAVCFCFLHISAGIRLSGLFAKCALVSYKIKFASRSIEYPQNLCATTAMQIQLTLSLHCRLLMLMRPLGYHLLALAHLVVDQLSPLQ